MEIRYPTWKTSWKTWTKDAKVQPSSQSASESILNLCNALISFETTAPVLISDAKEAPPSRPL